MSFKKARSPLWKRWAQCNVVLPLSILFAAFMPLTNRTAAVAATTSEYVAESISWPKLQSTIPFHEWHNPAVKMRGIVVAVHGTTQQSECFKTIGRCLADNGFIVVAMDLRGHGKWFFSSNEFSSGNEINYKRSIQDLLTISRQLKMLNPKLPLFCIGESVGSAVVVRAASVHRDLFDGIVLASAGTIPRFYNWKMVSVDFVKGITDLNKPLDVSQYITRYSSEDPRITHEMVTDPLSRTMLTGKEILRTGHFIRSTASYARKLTPNISVLILQGADDQIVRPSSIEPILRHLPSSDKKLVVISSCGHILLGTAYLKQSVVHSLTSWLNFQTDLRQLTWGLGSDLNRAHGKWYPIQ